MGKISDSEHVEFINESLLGGVMSLDDIVVSLRKRGFNVSKGTLATYSRELKAVSNNDILESYSSDLEGVKGNLKEIDYKKEYRKQRKVLFEMYDLAVDNAYMLTRSSIKSKKVLPLNLFKSIGEIQKLIRGQNELINDS